MYGQESAQSAFTSSAHKNKNGKLDCGAWRWLGGPESLMQ
jgi:hypothetical protein